MKKIFFTILILILIIFVYVIYKNSNYFFSNTNPSYEPNKGCEWEEKKFIQAGIDLVVQSCTESDSVITFSESENLLIGKWFANPRYEFTIQVFEKDSSEEPFDVVMDWYNKLSAEQQNLCEVQNADVPISYLEDGSVYRHERPNPTEGKVRYAIVPKAETVQSIIDENGGLPIGNEFDYICGTDVGSTLSAYPPYFEFDDRSPSKYLKIGSYAFEAPPIDLNSIRF